jgi:hypothetical protein
VTWGVIVPPARRWPTQAVMAGWVERAQGEGMTGEAKAKPAEVAKDRDRQHWQMTRDEVIASGATPEAGQLMGYGHRSRFQGG